MVHQCYRSVRIPIVGCGGISSAEDAVEFMLAGASAVQVGTASFIDPGAMQKIIEGLQRYCTETGVQNIRDLTGQVKLDRQLSDRWLRFAQQSG
jgi:dihydroorotate dehydrogenase (NAD+) catalytic subunit